jgi:hypothetical protein
MGERKIKSEAMQVRTPGGVVEVRWDERGKATAMGQLAFFAEYLEATGLFEGWLRSCPLRYSSPNAPKLVDVCWAHGCCRSWTGIAATRMWVRCAEMGLPRTSWA